MPMAVVKTEIPILEFVAEQTAVINPTHEKLVLKLPKESVFAFLGENITEYANRAEPVKASEFFSMTTPKMRCICLGFQTVNSSF